ncbi:MAG TPA: ADP-ribosylglycohydrolase family protein [Longimicrobiaceae bacterium]|nr:ADP-ribosylglycohydrolase family protein [Longimicrobiaceae bacterium]
MTRDRAVRDRRRGALLGLAVGDAVGAAVEFQPPGSFAPLAAMVGGGPWCLEPGQWTDDTSMALCLAESLVGCGGFDARDQMERYLRWWTAGHLSSTGECFDIGATARAALVRFRHTRDPFAGATDPHRAGNGSLMRLAPVPVFFVANPERAIHLSGESSRTTHAAPAAVDACRYFAALLVGALRGATKKEILSPCYSPTPGLWERKPLVPEIVAIAEGSYRRKSPPEIRGSGYVVQTLEAALWAFHSTESFRDGCLAAANLGDDADTTAAVFGQLAGAFYGETAIPVEWRHRLAMYGIIDHYAEALADAAY